MAFIQQTPDKLALTFRPWYMWIVGGICGLVWLPFIFSFSFLPINTALICQRTEPPVGSCQLVNKNFFFISNNRTIPIEEFQIAQVEQENIAETSGEFQKVVLLTKKEKITFRSVKTFRPNITISEMNGIADKINNFLKNPQESYLKVENGFGIVGYFFLQRSLSMLCGWHFVVK